MPTQVQILSPAFFKMNTNWDHLLETVEHRKIQLEKLKKISYKEGNNELEFIKHEFLMIIRRIYPNPDEIKEELLPQVSLWLVSGDESLNDKTYQENYEIKIDQLIRAYELIKREYILFDFDDFKPLKEKQEASKEKTKWRIGLHPKDIFYEKEKSKN